MNQEERIIKLEKLICNHTIILNAIDLRIRPMVLEWEENRENEYSVTRMILDE